MKSFISTIFLLCALVGFSGSATAADSRIGAIEDAGGVEVLIFTGGARAGFVNGAIAEVSAQGRLVAEAIVVTTGEHFATALITQLYAETPLSVGLDVKLKTNFNF